LEITHDLAGEVANASGEHFETLDDFATYLQIEAPFATGITFDEGIIGGVNLDVEHSVTVQTYTHFDLPNVRFTVVPTTLQKDIIGTLEARENTTIQDKSGLSGGKDSDVISLGDLSEQDDPAEQPPLSET